VFARKIAQLREWWDMKKATDIFKNEKFIKISLAAGFGIIMLILLSELFSFSSSNVGSRNTATTEIDPAAYSAELEERLAVLISEIQGVGKVSVMLTLESLDTSVPRVRGAAIVCEGSDDIFIKQRVLETASKVLGITTARVSVTY